MTEEASKAVWKKAGYPEVVESGPQRELYEMLRELRRLQFIASEADKAVLTQYCLLWKAYENKCENLMLKKEAGSQAAKFNLPDSPTGIVRLVVNGEPLMRSELWQKMVERYGDVLTNEQFSSGLGNLVRMKEAIKIGMPGNLRYVARVASVLVVLLLVGCSVGRLGTPAFKDDPMFEDSTAAIMPRRFPDAPRPATLAPVLSATTSANLSWERVPWARAYRVDYGTDFLTNSLMTQATDCTIHGLELGRVYHYNVRACDGRNYGPVLNVVIK